MRLGGRGLDLLVAAIDSLKKENAEWILQGSVHSMEDYKYKIGFLDGLDQVLVYVDEIESKLAKGE